MQIGKRGKIHIQEDGRIIGLVRSTPLPQDDAKLQPRTEEIRRGLSKLSCEATVVCGVNRDGKVVDYRVFSTLQESETRCDPGAIRQMVRAERPDGALVAHSHPSGLLTPSGPEIRAQTATAKMLAEERLHLCDELLVGPDGSDFSYREAITAPDWLQRKQRILADGQRHQEAMARLEHLEAKADLGLAELRLAGIVDRYVQRLEALAERR